MSFPVYSKGTDMEKAPRTSGGQWRLLIWTEGQLPIVEFCSFVALLKILSITLARAIKPFTYSGLCLRR